MKVQLLEDTTEPSWIDLLLECIDAKLTPAEVRAFISHFSSTQKQA